MLLNKHFWFVVFSVIAILLAATLQSSHMFGIVGIRPDLVLVVLVVLSFFTESLVVFSLLVLLGSIGIHFEPGISAEPVALAVLSLTGFFIKNRAVWPGLAATGILLFLGTFALYALIEPSFIYNHFTVVLFEAVYNIVLGLVLFEAISLYVKKTQFTI